jgi:SAM-dependent methyltransferase
MNTYREVTACRLCDSTDLTEALRLPDTPLANELDGTELFPLVVNWCGSCGHHQLSIAVSPGRLWGPDYPYQSGTSPVFRKHLEALADEVATLKPGGCVLEIASNDGTLVDMLTARGLLAAGVDPSGPDAPARGLQPIPWPPRTNPPSGPGAGVRLARMSGMLDCILALNVFAHVDDLHSFTAAVKEALAPDGVFIVEVGYQPEVAERGHFDTIYHEHMSYHSVAPLEKFFHKHGLGIEREKENDSQGGSVRLYVKHRDKLGVLWATHDPSPMEQLRPIIDSRAAALKHALNTLFHRGEMVCIYGAPAKLTTLLYATGLEKMPFNCVGDDNPRKVGRTTPGNHIPIVSVEDMLARKPDTVLVASWNFFDDIRRKLRDMGFRGGIINPMGSQEHIDNNIPTGPKWPIQHD